MYCAEGLALQCFSISDAATHTVFPIQQTHARKIALLYFYETDAEHKTGHGKAGKLGSVD